MSLANGARLVAVKTLRSELAGSTEARERFEREARTTSRLSHPHICAIYDVGHADGIEYLVMEAIEPAAVMGSADITAATALTAKGTWLGTAP